MSPQGSLFNRSPLDRMHQLRGAEIRFPLAPLRPNSLQTPVHAVVHHYVAAKDLPRDQQMQIFAK